jgi:hypothetical protein
MRCVVLACPLVFTPMLDTGFTRKMAAVRSAAVIGLALG